MGNKLYPILHIDLIQNRPILFRWFIKADIWLLKGMTSVLAQF